MGSVLIGGAWGEVVGAGASTNKPATERARSVTVGDEVGARKICEAGCVLGMWQACGRLGLVGAGHFPANAISRRAALDNGLGRKWQAVSVFGTW